MLASTEVIAQIGSIGNQQQPIDIDPSEQLAQLNDTQQVYDFQSLVNGNQAASVGGVNPSSPDFRVQTLGDAILKGMHSMTSNIDDGFQNFAQMSSNTTATEMVEGASNIHTVTQMLGMQVQAIKLGFELQLSGQIVNKSTQDIETFLKAQ